MQLEKVLPLEVKKDDFIMPPQRELSLWMRRTLKEKNLPEEALLLKVKEIQQSMPDKKGEWIMVKTMQSEAFTVDHARPYPEGREFNFKVRPATLLNRRV